MDNSYYVIQIWSYGKKIDEKHYSSDQLPEAAKFYRNNSLDLNSSAPVAYVNGKKLSIVESDNLFIYNSSAYSNWNLFNFITGKIR